MKKCFFIISLLFVPVIHPEGRLIYGSDIRISEVLASNVTVNYDDVFYNFGDWIELYNASSSDKDLNGYYLTDDPNELFKYRIDFHFNLYPGSHRIFWADSYDNYAHTNFSIDSDGEFLALVDPSGNIVDSVTIGPQFPDISYGRDDDDKSTWYYYQNPSPGTPNSGGLEVPEFSDDVHFSPAGGFYMGSVSVDLTTDNPVGEIRYTLDGSFPNAQSTLYTGPISISSDKILRARSYTSQKLPSPVFSNSYFIDEDSLTLPVISLSTWDAYLNDSMIGIYVVGVNGKIDNCIDSAVNFNQDWERPVNFEYFTPSGEQVLNQLVGIKINGGCSRNVPSKSFAVYAREKYGLSRMQYPLFHNKDIPEYKNLILRNTGNDYYYAYMRDGFMHTLVADVTDIEYQSYQPVRMYINGNYWGILNMREKQNEHYLAANHGVDPDEVDLIESNSIVIEGTEEHYVAMMDFLRNSDITAAANYERMCSLMDMNQFIDYYIAQIYFENEDWPFHNIKCWRPQTEGGKWRWLLFDTDYGFGRWPKSGNTVNWAFMENWEPTELGATLIKNASFRNEFVQRFAVHLSTLYTPERVVHILDSLRANLDTEMHLHIERWGSPWAHGHWLDKVQVMEDFALGRGALMYQQINEKFELEGTISLVLSSANEPFGKIRLHDIPLDSTTVTTLFRDVPLRVQAVPENGYVFSHWSGASTSTNPAITLTLTENDTLIAHFRHAKPVRDLYINELSSLSDNAIPDEQGESEDWIEIYNGNSNPVYLNNLYLTDSLDDPFKHKITDDNSTLLIQPGEYILLFADGEPGQGIRHLNFKLSNKGETIALIQKTYNSPRIIDSVSFKKQIAGTTYGRSPDDPERFQFLIPTPGSENAEKRIENIVINEFMASNRSVISDENGEYEDWIEIYNPGNDTISLSGMFLTDSLQNRMRYQLPYTDHDSLTLLPREHIVFWADNQPEQGVRHLGFKLSSRGESVGLIQPNGIDFIDSLSYGDIRQDVAIGCLPDGSIQRQLVTPTPGRSNTVRLIRNVFINEFMASNTYTYPDEINEYDDWIEIYNANSFEVNIGGLYITDSLNNPMKHKLSLDSARLTTIPPSGHLILWADNQPEQGILHLGFKLSTQGEEIGLFLEDGITPVDSLGFNASVPDAAVGRFPDGSAHMENMIATPGTENIRKLLENIFITELAASKNNQYSDEHGELNDWIEIFNNNAYPVDIGGVYFTDSLADRQKHRISSRSPDMTTIPPKARLIIWADNQPDQGVLHLNFALSGDGEALALINTDGCQYLDSITFPDQFPDISFGRKEDTLGWLSMRPTPGTSNMIENLQDIVINEFMADNQNKFEDEYGNFSDWIEIYNSGSQPINIGGCFLTDSIGDVLKFRIPAYLPEITTIPAKDYLIVFADDSTSLGSLHANFKLSRQGEDIAIYHYNAKERLDAISYPAQYENFAYGRVAPTNQWLSIPPTPEAANLLPDLSGLVINELMPDNDYWIPDENGEYDDWIELYNSGDETIDIGGLFLSDSISDKTKHRISSLYADSTTIAPGGFLLLWADNDEEQGIQHLGFKLSKDAEEIALFSYDGTLIDGISYTGSQGLSYGRAGNGHTDWIWFEYPSPRASNVYTAIPQTDPAAISLLVYPNPMRQYIRFVFTSPNPERISLAIYNLSGNLVYEEQVNPDGGRIEIEWNGKSGPGQSLAPGLYLFRLVSGEQVITGRIVKE